MLIFIDESWQSCNGCAVGALGAVAIPQNRYNHFCSVVWAIKANVLGAAELSQCEIKGNHCFAKSAFRRQEHHGHSTLLQAAEEMFDAMSAHGARAFAVWTTDEKKLRLRSATSTQLSEPYLELLHDLRRHMRCVSPRKGMLFFDQRGHTEDLATACAVQNYLTRTSREWPRRFVQVPHFTRSPVSPGLQAADLVAYLAARQTDLAGRPELASYWERVKNLAYVHHTARAARPALRLVA
jgi:hypothetical protein